MSLYELIYITDEPTKSTSKLSEIDMLAESILSAITKHNFQHAVRIMADKYVYALFLD